MRPELSVEKLLIAGNRGPCGGVNMALEATNQVLSIVDGRESVYTNWNPVNNRPITEELKQRGLVDIKNNWTQVPEGSIVLFSAHGIPPSFRELAQQRGYLAIDTTCHLVTRVHNLAKKAEREGKHVVYIGVDGHPETEGVRGEIQPDNFTLIEKLEDAKELALPEDKTAVVYSQTTLSTTEIREVLKGLSQRPNVIVPNRWDICYATDNRQQAVDDLIQRGIDSLLVVGSPHSHNSQELRRKGELAGKPSHSVDYPDEINIDWYHPETKIVGITSGASVLDRFMVPIINWFEKRNPEIQIDYLPQVVREDEMTFKLPQQSIDQLKARFVF